MYNQTELRLTLLAVDCTCTVDRKVVSVLFLVVPIFKGLIYNAFTLHAFTPSAFTVYTYLCICLSFYTRKSILILFGSGACSGLVGGVPDLKV